MCDDLPLLLGTTVLDIANGLGYFSRGLCDAPPMKPSVVVSLAISAAAAVILTGLWAKARVEDWEHAWRSCREHMSAITTSELAYSRAWQYRASFSSPEVALEETRASLKRLQDLQIRIAQIERRMLAILEQKPFSLPLTTVEREELQSAKENIQKHEQKAK